MSFLQHIDYIEEKVLKKWDVFITNGESEWEPFEPEKFTFERDGTVVHAVDTYDKEKLTFGFIPFTTYMHRV